MPFRSYVFLLAAVLFSCLMADGGLNAAPPTVSIYLVNTPYSVILPGQQVYLRGYFSDEDFGETFNIEWDFGNGATATEVIKTTYDCYANPGRCTPYRRGCFSYLNAHYSYKRPGSYEIVLNVTDSKSEHRSDRRILDVIDPKELTEKILSTMRNAPLESFRHQEEKKELVQALEGVYNNLERRPVEALGILKTSVMPRITRPHLSDKRSKKLAEAAPLLEALANYLSL